MRVFTFIAASLIALPAWAEDASAPPPTAPAQQSPEGASLLDQIDVAAGAPPKAAPPSAPAPGGVARAFQSLNPDISVILDETAGYAQRAPLRLAGDDPDLGGDPGHRAAGFTLQEAEVAFQSTVDPYFRADVFLTIPNQSGLEVEEAYATTLDLPAQLQLKAGIFRSAFGRQNGQHLHVQDFTRRPLINGYLGTDGLRPPGAQLSWLAPLPFFLQLDLEAFSAPRSDLSPSELVSTFGGGSRTDLTYATELKVFAPATESLSIYGGLSAAIGRASFGSLPAALDVSLLPAEGARSSLYGADLYVKYKPPNQAGGYFSLAWTTEYFLRSIAGHPSPSPGSPENVVGAQTDGGIYTQLVAQLARRWFAGVRWDALGLPTSTLQPRVLRASADVTFVPSEFSKVRAYVEEELPNADAPAFKDLGLSPTNNLAAYVQLEIAIGAHGAHAF